MPKGAQNGRLIGQTDKRCINIISKMFSAKYGRQGNKTKLLEYIVLSTVQTQSANCDYPGIYFLLTSIHGRNPLLQTSHPANTTDINTVLKLLFLYTREDVNPVRALKHVYP
jgi:hypothetical protein